MERVFKITADGSHTLYVEALDETYHSKHGAIQEAEHVFIKAGLDYFTDLNLNILEVGFGTGLNTFLTLISAKQKDIDINYTGLEAYPLEDDMIQQLNYTTELNLIKEEQNLFHKLHKAEWESVQKITPLFNLTKLKMKLADFKIKNQFDVIYFDAFGPNVQPEMWT